MSGFAHALQQAGYATDGSYAAKIVSIAQSPLMTQVLQTIGASPNTGVATNPSTVPAQANPNAASRAD